MDIQLIILKIIAGDFAVGFTVALDVETFQNQHHHGQQKDFYGRLPAFSGFSDSPSATQSGLDELYGY